MSLTIPIIAADGAQSVVTLADAVVGSAGLLQSPNDLTQPAWSKSGIVVTHVADGTSIIEDASSGYHYTEQHFSNSGAQTYVLTIEVKPAGRSLYIQLSDVHGGGGGGFILVGTGSEVGTGIYGSEFTLLAHSIALIDNGYYRISITVVMTAVVTSPAVQIFAMNNFNAESYQGAGDIGFVIRALDLSKQVAVVAISGFVAANGNDANPGTQAAPWSINKLSSMVAPGTTFFLRSGDIFNANVMLNIAGGGDPANPVVIDCYGTINPDPSDPTGIGRATLRPAAGGEGIIDTNRMKGWEIHRLVLEAPDLTKMPRAGIMLYGEGQTGFVIDRVDVSGLRFNTINADFGSCIFFHGPPGAGLINNCNIHGEAGVNSRTDCGMGGFGGSNSNAGLLETRGVLCYNIGSAGSQSANVGQVYPPLGNGLSVDGAVGGWKVRGCIVGHCGGNYNNLGGGPAAFLTHATDKADIRLCWGYSIRPTTNPGAGADWITYDLDNAATRSIVKWCFSNDSWNSGFMSFDRTGLWNDNEFSNCLGVNDCEQGASGFMPLCIDAGGLQRWKSMVTYNDRVYNGVQFQNQFQGNGFISVKSNFANGEISNCTGVMSTDIYGFYQPVNARSVTPPITITGNQWFGRTGAFLSWWGAVQYFSLAAWQAAAGETGNTAVSGNGPNVYNVNTLTVSLTGAESAQCVTALQRVQNYPGIESGNSPTGVPLPGTVMAALAARLAAGNNVLTIPEATVLDFALCRANADALRIRLEALAA